MQRIGVFQAREAGLDCSHAEYGRWLVDHGRVSDELPPDDAPVPLAPRPVTPAQSVPEAQHAASRWLRTLIGG